jgi:hypothetical protein
MTWTMDSGKNTFEIAFPVPYMRAINCTVDAFTRCALVYSVSVISSGTFYIDKIIQNML